MKAGEPTILDLYVDAVSEVGGKVLFGDARSRMTYEQSARRVLNGVKQLRLQLRLRPGDRVVCYTDSTIPLALFYLAAGLARVIAVPMSQIFSSDYLSATCKQCCARAIFTTPALEPKIRHLGIPVITYGESATDEPWSPSRPEILNDVPMPRDEMLSSLKNLAARIGLFDSFLIQPTAGSGGNPKLVLRNFAALSRYAHYVGDQIAHGNSSPRSILLATAFTHAFAVHMFAVALRFRAEVLVPTELDIRASLDEVRTLDPEIITATPRVLRSFLLQNKGSGSRIFGPEARVVLCAGGRADPETFRRLRAEDVEAMEFYGSSEASVIAVTPYRSWSPGCAGIPVSDVSLKFSKGEILVKTPGMMLGYYGDLELTRLAFDEDGYFKTGDLGEIDSRGYLRILGRRREVFNTPEGTNIYPDRIEMMLESVHDSVEHTFVVGDARPYVTAHLVINPSALGAVVPAAPMDEWADSVLIAFGAIDASSSATPSGILDSERYADLYRVVGLAISKMNEDLEIIERVVAFALYATPFDDDVYSVITAGKIHRSRDTFLERYRRSVDLLYSRDVPHDSVMLVPPRERRFTVRTR